MNKKRAIIAGGRNFVSEIHHIKWLDSLVEKLEIGTVLCGMANGADKFGRSYAMTNGVAVEEYPADWKQYGKLAGPIRNKKMADNADICILFHGGKGTKNMEDTARFLNIPVYKYSEEKEHNL